MIRTLLTVLVLSLLSTPVFGEWKKVSMGVDGTTNYVDFERIRKHGGYVYYWELKDIILPNRRNTPNTIESISGKTYIQGDCKLFRFKNLSASIHKEPMGGGTPSISSNTPDKEWNYPSPNSVDETLLKSVCAYAK